MGTTVLHITDLHFGWGGTDENKLAERKVCLDSLLASINALDSSWKPSIICVSGDIGWRGVTDNYDQAKQWFDLLLTTCAIGYDRLVLSAGNHDLLRSEAVKNARPNDVKEADEVLGVPIAAHYLKPFTAFVDFCQSTGVKPFSFGGVESYLVGIRLLDGLKFISLNSSWFAKDETDKGRLWLGFPHLKYLEAQNQIELVHQKAGLPVTIALLHHPKEWLHEAETQVWNTRQNPWDYLAHRCHVVFTGHTHGEVRPADRIAESAYHLTGGSAYAGASHFNSIRLLRVESNQLEYRSLEFDPRSSENKWRSSHANILPLEEISSPPSTDEDTTKLNVLMKKIRIALKADANRILDAKSRLLKPVGVLPRVVPQQVSLRVSSQLDRYDTQGRLIREKNSEQLMPFYEAARGSRRTLLLGDLGTGKSVLGANLIIETIERSETAIAAIIPVKSLNLVGQFSIHDLLDAVDKYLSNHAAPTLVIKLKELLNSQVEVLLVLDGVDELDRTLATRLLNRAGTLPEHWPTIQIVVTGRPVELMGVAYADWRVVQTAPLNDDLKRQFLKEELLADGAIQDVVDTEVDKLFGRIKALSELNALASSPLTIRLLSSRLRSASYSTEDVTLGDLLYDLLMERLGIWASRDDKTQKFDGFESTFPTPEAKSIYLSNIALMALAGVKLSRDAAKALLEDTASGFNKSNKFRLVDEALAYFQLAGLITGGDSIEFLVQPLAEVAAAIGIAAGWSKTDNGWELPSVDRWRVVSFVATVSRRKGALNKVEEPILLYTQSLLANPAQFPAACYIAVETADESCARKIVDLFTTLGRRPLALLQKERVASARNVARTLWLAKDSGFDWFYGQYLDPKYPVTLLGVGLVEEVLTHWTSLVIGRLTESQRQRLSTLVRPYLATGEAQFFGVLSHLSFLVPEAFSIEDRLWFQSALLDNSLLGGRAADEIIAADAGSAKHLVSEVLMHRVGESTRAIRLWFDINPNADLSPRLIEAVYKTLTRARSKSDAELLTKLCREQLGNDRWFWFARWILLGGDNTASCGAAIALYNAGERRLQLLGRVLMRAMHDGGFVAEAEKILSALIKQHGEGGVRWLASRMAEEDERLGGHSGWWRILLSEIENLSDGPSLFANSLPALGSFILPRYPEIRERVTYLLKGARGREFREALLAQLHCLDPRVRRRAAVILVTVDPRHEGDALFIAVRSRAERHAIDWHEWEEFCLSLDFGPSVLAQLKSRLDLLEKESRAFALAILAKGKIQLEQSYRDELTLALLAIGNWQLNVEGLGSMALESANSQERLLQQLNLPRTESAERAAARLLESHRSELTLEQESKCIALTTKRSRFNHDIVKQMLRIKQDAAFAEALGKACEDIVEQGGNRPLLQLVLKTNTDSTLWKDLVWNLLCDDSGIHTGSDAADDMGPVLLDYGREMLADAKFIGQAAKEWLKDQRVRQNRWGDAYHWLGVLADEFVGLSQQELRDVLNKGGAIWYSAATALIARLGEVPQGFHCLRAKERLRPNRPPAEKLPSDQVINLLKDYSRDSEELHPNIMKAIEEALFLPFIPEDTLSEFVAAGNPGRLIAISLCYAYGQAPNLADTIPLMDMWGRFYRPGYQQKRDEQRLHQVWLTVRRMVIEADSLEKENYLAALDSTLVDGETWKLPVALEILQIRGSLLPTQIGGVFRTYSKYSTIFHEVLFKELVLWFSRETDRDTIAAITNEAAESVVTLNEEPWNASDGYNREPWAFVLFPIVTWLLSGKSTSESEAVFLRGIKFAFHDLSAPNKYVQGEIVSLIATLEPLLKKISPEILRHTIRRGLENLDPAVRAFSRLISSFNN